MLHPATSSSTRPFAFLTPLLLAFCLNGCGSDGGGQYASPTVPVRGKVTHKGKPLTSGSITFEPDGGREAHGAIQADGSFTLTTFKEGDGAQPGLHRVAVDAGKSIPSKYRNVSSSKIEVDVSAAKSEYQIDIP